MTSASDIDIKAYESLGSDVNKPKGDGAFGEEREGVVSEKLPELELEMSDDDLVKLTQKWLKDWNESEVKSTWFKNYEENEKYWLGKQFDKPTADKRRADVDNSIFESVETYLPQVTRRNPEPLATLEASEDDDPLKDKYIQKVKNRLGDLADKNKLRLKLKRVARHWAIFLVGIGKITFDLDKDIPALKIIRPPKIILDPDATIDEDGYSGSRIGEHRKLEAGILLNIIGGDDNDAKVGPARKKIKELVKDELATEVQFIEWWTSQYMCWTLDKTVLLKRKNPHWNYDAEEADSSVDAYGNVTPSTTFKAGINHLPSPAMPYVFMSVFNLGDQPVDKTSLIGQNLANQDRINKRTKQIDKNADRMNGGMVVSLERSGLTQPQLKAVTKAIRNGGAVGIPTGSVQDAIAFPQQPALSADVYNDLVDTRNRLKDIFGTRGSNPAGIESERTVRGKILSRSLDTDRIGGGVSEYLEQFADDVYNWFLQMLYVYDDAFQFIEGARPPKVLISVKEGSLLPKDSTTIANQAIDLATAGKMSLVDMYERLEYPNPKEMAANVWLEQNAPHVLYKENPLIQEAILGIQQAQQPPEQQQAIPPQQAEGGSPPTEPRSILEAIPQEEVGPTI